jgi:hypothetical protein
VIQKKVNLFVFTIKRNSHDLICSFSYVGLDITVLLQSFSGLNKSINLQRLTHNHSIINEFLLIDKNIFELFKDNSIHESITNDV